MSQNKINATATFKMMLNKMSLRIVVRMTFQRSQKFLRLKPSTSPYVNS